MEGPSLSMAAPFMEGSLDPCPRMASLAVEGAKEALLRGSVLLGAVEAPASSSSEKALPFNGDRNLAVLDLERRGCAVALTPSFLVGLNSSSGGSVRPSPSPSKSSYLVKTSKVLDGGVSTSLRFNGQGVSPTRSELICLKDLNFEKSQLDGDVSSTVSHQLLDGTGHQTLDGCDPIQRLGSPFPPSSVDRAPYLSKVSCAEGLSSCAEAGHGEEAGLGALKQIDADLEAEPRDASASMRAPPCERHQIVGGSGPLLEPPPSRRLNHELGRAVRSATPLDAGARGRGGHFKRRAGGDLYWEKRFLGDLGRSRSSASREIIRSDLRLNDADGKSGSGPELDRGGSARGGLGDSSKSVGGGRPGGDGGRDDRRRGRGRGQHVWVGSSSSGCTDDNGAVVPDRARGRSPPCSGPVNLDRPCPVDARGRTRPSAASVHGLIADLPPRTVPLNLQSREKSSEVKAGGDGGQPVGAPELPKHASWREVVCGGKELRRPDRNLQFFPPSMVDGRRSARCSLEALAGEVQRWQSSLVGRKPYFPHLNKSLERSWRMEAGFELFSREEGLFIVRFSSVETCIRILESGPWFFEGKPILLRRWERGGASERALLHKAPLWIRLPLLPLELWTKENLNRIVSVIGTPLHVDLATATKSRIGFARCCVEVGYDDALPHEVPVTFDEDGELNFLQDVIYEWKPLRFGVCRVLGHEEGACPSPPLEPERRVLSSSERQQWHRVRNAVRPRGSIANDHTVAAPADQLGAAPAVGASVGEADTINNCSLAGILEGPADSIEREG